MFAAPIIEMIKMIRGHAFITLLILIVGAKFVIEKARADFKLMMIPISLVVFQSHQARLRVSGS